MIVVYLPRDVVSVGCKYPMGNHGVGVGGASMVWRFLLISFPDSFTPVMNIVGLPRDVDSVDCKYLMGSHGVGVGGASMVWRFLLISFPDSFTPAMTIALRYCLSNLAALAR